MNSSLYNGVSGIKTSQFYMDVVANNVSNVNTNGFKGSTAEVSSLFSKVLVGTYNAGSNDAGTGALSQTTSLNMAQGNLQNTDNTFDLALGNEGWFGVIGGDGKTYYTRAGSFSVDSNGNLVDANGDYLLTTLGNNITPTTLDSATLAKFGKIYSGTNTSSLTAYSITEKNDVPIGTVGSQSKVTLPKLLYYPPVATSKASYSANLDPTITTDAVTLNLNSADYPATVTPSATGTVSFSGTISNTTAAYQPKEGDVIVLNVTDANGTSQTIKTKLDSSLQWSVSNIDVSSLDTSSALTVSSATIQTQQEVATVEHFTSTVIGATGKKDTLDMTFTKQVPQGSSGTTWDATVKILSYYEDYTVEQYDATKTYDTTKYKVDKTAGTVTKIYDPTKYQVDTSTKKVYEIVDSQTGTVSFGGAGQLLSNTIPTLNNGGTALTLNLGTINGFDGLISSANIDKANSSTYNGSLEGFLSGYNVDENGNIVASFTNGKSSSIAKIPVYHFQNDQGLNSISSNLFEESANSGKAIFYTDSSGKTFSNTKIYSQKLESSNVDLATALTELIVVQKAFSASAKSITTSDDLLKNAINMKT